MRGLVATHGGIGAELVRVVEMIMGPGSGLTALSNQGKSAQDLTGEMGDWLRTDPARCQADEEGSIEPVVLFLDDYAGSCANSAQLASGGADLVAIVSGVNLAMLLGFVTWRDDLDFEDLVVRLVGRGRDAITRLGGGL